jgi:hypothetical protein
MIQCSLRTPAQMQSREDIANGPIHNFFKFIPVVYLAELEKFHGRSSYDHSVELSILNVVEVSVESRQMFWGSGLGLVILRM